MVILKLRLTEHDDFFAAFMKQLKVLKVVALSGGIFAGVGRRLVVPAV
jgi:hypothetical protein